MQSCSMLIQCSRRLSEFAVRSTNELGASQSQSYQLPLQPMEMSSTFWILGIMDWRRQQWKTHSMYADRSNVACDIFCIIPDGVGVEASSSPWRDVMSWRESKTTGKTVRGKVVVRQFSCAYNGIFAGDYPALDNVGTENDLELKKQGEERNCTTWLESKTNWKWGRPTKTCVLHRRNLLSKTSNWHLFNKFQTLKRWSKHTGQTFNMVVQLYWNFQKDHRSHQHCLQRTSREDELR